MSQLFGLQHRGDGIKNSVPVIQRPCDHQDSSEHDFSDYDADVPLTPGKSPPMRVACCPLALICKVAPKNESITKKGWMLRIHNSKNAQ